MWAKFFQKERGLDSYFPYVGFVEEGIMFLKNKGFASTFEIRGKDLSSSTNYELSNVSRIINSSLMQLGDGWMAHIDTIRDESKYYPSENECFFKDKITKAIDISRRQIFQSNEMCFENKYYLTLTFVPMTLNKNSFLFGEEKSTKKNNTELDILLVKYGESINKFLNIFSNELFVKKLSSEEMLVYLHKCITGKKHKISMPVIPMYLDHLLASEDLYGGIKPKIGKKNIRVIAIKSLPSYLHTGFLDVLNNLPFSFRFSSRFIFLDQATSRKKIEKIRKDWDQAKHTVQSMINDKIGSMQSTSFANNDAIEMSFDADNAVRLNQSQQLGYGCYTASIVLMEEDETKVEENADQVLKELEKIGFPCFVETINAVEAYLGAIPAVGYANIRKPIISTLNLAHLMPLTAAWSGDDRHPNERYGVNAPPLLYAASAGLTPFKVSLHVGDVGHSLIIGSTGSGKSTLLAFIAAQHFRYKNAQIFAFDKGNSIFTLCKAAGGSHFDLGANNKSISFCPLSELESPDDITFAIEWISSILELQFSRNLNQDEQLAIKNAIEIMRKETQASDGNRTLSTFVSQVQNHDIREVLYKYIDKKMYGNIFDGNKDFITDSLFNVFEMENLIEKGEEILLPALTYMFKIIKRKLDGRPTLLILDEAWIFLKNKFFIKRIEQWLREMRRFNCAVIFATQSVSEVKNSEIFSVILESCKTKIYLPNPAMYQNPEIRKIYESFGLNEKQIEIIAKSQQKREYYLSSEKGNRLFEILFDKLTLSFIGVSSESDLSIVKKMMEEKQNDWIYSWLEHKKISNDWIEYIKNLNV